MPKNTPAPVSDPVPIVDPGATLQPENLPIDRKPDKPGPDAIDSINQAIIRIVMGKRGCGKTTKAWRLVDECLNPDRVLFYDTLGHDYKDGVVFYDLAGLKAYWRQVYRGAFRLIYRPENPEEDFAAVCRMVYSCGDMVFVVEELDLYFKGGGACCSELTCLVMRGRHKVIDLIGVTQRPRGFGRSFTAMTTGFYVFRTAEPDDVSYFGQRLGQAVADRLPTLGLFEYVEMMDVGGLDGGFEVRLDDPPER